MKVSHKKIRRVTPVIVDSYYGCTMDDFLDDDQCAEINAQRIRDVIFRGRLRRAAAKEGMSIEFDTTWNCQSGMLSNQDPDLEGRYDPWEDDYEPPPRYVPAEPYDSAYREKEALEALGYRVP